MFDEARSILEDNPPGELDEFFSADSGSPNTQTWKDIAREVVRNATNKHRTCAQFINGCEVEGLQFVIPRHTEDSDGEGPCSESSAPQVSLLQLAFIRTKVSEPLRSLAGHDIDDSPTSGHMLPFFNMLVSLALPGDSASHVGRKRRRGIHFDESNDDDLEFIDQGEESIDKPQDDTQLGYTFEGFAISRRLTAWELNYAKQRLVKGR